VPSSEPFGWALVGPGNIARRFAGALRAIDGARLAAVVGRDDARAAAFAREWAHGAWHGSDLAAALARADVHAVYVCTPHPFHANAVRAALGELGASAIGPDTLDALRVEDGVPWYGPDVTEASLLHETGLVARYHSPTKGCYVGQENIARLEARGGRVNKSLRGLRLTAPAAAGDAILFEGAEVGRVTTAAVSPRLGPIAMGYVHRSRADAGTRVEVGGAPAAGQQGAL